MHSSRAGFYFFPTAEKSKQKKPRLSNKKEPVIA